LSATQTPGDALSRVAGKSASDSGAVIGFKCSQAGFEELTTRHDDDVEAGRDLVLPEYFPNQSFRAISLHGAAEFFRRRDPQAAPTLLVGESKDRAESAVNTRALLVHPLKFGASANPLMRLKALATHGYQLSAVGHQVTAVASHQTVRRFQLLAADC
jgi:hypothetical protein